MKNWFLPGLIEKLPCRIIIEALDIITSKLTPLLGELVNYGFLKRVEKRYEVSHALVHTFARTKMVPTQECVNKISAYFIRFAKDQSQKGLEGYTILSLEKYHVIGIIENCYEKEKWEHVIDLAFAIQGYLDLSGFWFERKRILTKALTAARNNDDRYSESAFLGNLGNAYSDLGEVEKAIEYYEKALVISRKIGHQQGEGNHLGNLGIAYSSLGEVEKSRQLLQQSLAILEDIKSPNADIIRKNLKILG